VWTITFRGRSCSVRQSKGVGDLVHLLQRPGREVPAVDLVAPGGHVIAGDVGETIDATARAAYRARLARLDAELSEADERGDAERSARLDDERRALLGQLAGAFGLGGRPRRGGASAERARTAVTARLRDAIRRIGQVDPDLGRHLARSVRTGTFCCYDPEPPTTWQV
jgi:hypothetical protein